MNQLTPAPLNTGELLDQSWRMFRSHLWTFIRLMGYPIAASILSGVVTYFLEPVPDGVPLRDVWEGTITANKIAVLLLFLASIAVFYHVLGVTIWAAGEFLAGRDVRVWESFRHFRGKQARLFWLLLLIGIFSRGLVIIPLLVGFAIAPAFPVAALENLGVIKAIQRGDALSKGSHGRIAVLYLSNLVLVYVGIFGLILGLSSLQDSFGKAWFLRPVFPVGFWIILLVPQFYMVALTLNYFDMRFRRGEWPSAATFAVPTDSSAPAGDRSEILNHETRS